MVAEQLPDVGDRDWALLPEKDLKEELGFYHTHRLQKYFEILERLSLISDVSIQNLPTMSAKSCPNLYRISIKTLVKIRDYRPKKKKKEEEERSRSRPSGAKLRPDFSWSLSEDQKQGWKSTYPHVDVEEELSKMAQWAKANPRRHKKNWDRFINNWLKSSNEKRRKEKQFNGFDWPTGPRSPSAGH